MEKRALETPLEAYNRMGGRRMFPLSDFASDTKIAVAANDPTDYEAPGNEQTLRTFVFTKEHRRIDHRPVMAAICDGEVIEHWPYIDRRG